jgi:hypothetical protein
MSIDQFINEYRDYINMVMGHNSLIDADQEEIELWIMNDEGLYTLAMSEGVEV